MTILKRIRALLTTMGPAPAKPAPKAGEKPSLPEGDRAMFDDPDGEPAGDEPIDEDPQGDAGDDPAGDPEAGDEGGEDPADGDEPDGEEDPDARDTRAEDEDADEETDGDEDGEDEDSEEEDGEDADDASTALRTSWETRLEAAARGAGDSRPRLNLSRVTLREDAKKKFDELRAKGADGEHDAEAIFEVAMDAAFQVLGAYHDDVAKPSTEHVEKNLRNVQVGRTLNAFRKQMGASLTPAVEKRMAALYTAWAGKYGWRETDKVPLHDLFRMAGGRKVKATAAGKAGSKDPAAAAKAQKREALGAAAAGPRALGRTRPEGGSRPPAKEDKALREVAEQNRSNRPFFVLG